MRGDRSGDPPGDPHRPHPGNRPAEPDETGCPDPGGRLHQACTGVLSRAGVDGAGITVMGGPHGDRDQVAATGALTRRLEELQMSAGEGPCVEAYTGGVPVLVDDLSVDSARWPGFAPDAVAAGAAAVFSLPLQVGAIGLGTLDLHRSHAGRLSPEQLAAALAVAETATEALLEYAGAGAGEDVGWLPGVHADVHIASGVLSVQIGVDVGTALLRLRAHSFAHGEPLHEVARRVIDHTLVLADAGDDRRNPPRDTHPNPHPKGDDR